MNRAREARRRRPQIRSWRHRTPQLYRELVLARLAIANELLRTRVKILFSAPDTLFEGRRGRLVQNLHPTTRTF
jgi:hypothetical protein